MHGKTPREQEAIVLEAERRVRAGEPRAEVARALGIPLSTLSGWAHRGGWRRRDLVTVRDAERGEMILELIDEITAQEREKQLADAAKLREALEASKAELEAAAPGGRLSGLPGAMGEGALPAQKLAMALADSLLRQGRLEEADRAVRLAARFAEAEQAAGAREEARWREERERLTKWWAERQADLQRLHALVEFALVQVATAHEVEDSRSADKCCPKCNRRMDFWPEEVERADDDDDSDDSGAGESGDDDSSRRKDDDDSVRTAVDDDDFLPVAVP